MGHRSLGPQSRSAGTNLLHCLNCFHSSTLLFKFNMEKNILARTPDRKACNDSSFHFKKPFLKYELLVWLIFGCLSILWVVDRFTWNFWPREMYRIGAGTAGSDFKDGLKPGPWTVKVYDAVARISGRYSIIALNLLLFTMMKSFMSWTAESWIARHVIDFSDSIEGNRRLHKWNGIGIIVMTLLHVWSILFPCIFHGWKAQVVLGNFEWILSERGPKGFKDANVTTETMSLQGDDVFRIVEMTILLAILLPLSVRWLSTRWHLGIHVHNIINVLYFIDIVRRHTHPHSWILNTPFFIAWIVDNIIGIFWRRARPKMYRVQLSDDYILLFSNEKHMLYTVGPKYYLRLVQSSFLERAHVFTTFHNHQNMDLADGRPWTTCFLIRVYHSRRRPVLGKKDKISHTKRVAEESNLDIYQWGPFQGSMSESVRRSIDDVRPVCLVAGGSAAGYIIDAIQHHRRYQKAYLTALYTTRDIALFKWVVRVIHTLIGSNGCENVFVVVALTNGNRSAPSEAENFIENIYQEIDESWTTSSSSTDEPSRGRLQLQCGRISFDKLIPQNNIVFFQGSGGLQKAVHRSCKMKHCNFIAGPAYDQDPAKKRFLLKGLRMNSLSQKDELV